ncbi:MAG: septum formation initiator family protein [Bacteroidetes bacterium]|nr:septum formation initiator family protein [Bacteroidota bacterium]MBU1373185.1 septum formation initiator family protein [Bacteroidota bacterium]MBU1486257.1 septum formation initiator family protein [Bacteroidota bacterium]MBU1761316.1 septum formation initiator family protein [Bacteroidota bacterium]MBU2045806.1 septum formation initiator family protein [Bacteroidota bacterium]
MKRLFNLIKNKYFLASLAFIVWMVFFDRNDMTSQLDYRSKVNKLEEEKDFYTKEIAKAEKDLQELTTNPDRLEKFARERYYMRRDNEDIYVVVDEKDKKKDNKSSF